MNNLKLFMYFLRAEVKSLQERPLVLNIRWLDCNIQQIKII